MTSKGKLRINYVTDELISDVGVGQIIKDAFLANGITELLHTRINYILSSEFDEGVCHYMRINPLPF